MITDSNTPTSRRSVRLVAATIALGATAAVAAVAMTGSAHAGRTDPAITAATTGFTPGTVSLPPFTFVTQPPFTVLPPVTFGTLVTVATTSTTPTDTTDPTETTEPTESTDPTHSTDATETTEGSGSAGGPEEYAVTVTAAQINCDGTIHVEYDTVAQPQPQTAASHLVVFNPYSNPTDFHAVETAGNPANGSFTFDELGSISDSYRVFVIATFDPTNPDGPIAIDQTDALPAPTC